MDKANKRNRYIYTCIVGTLIIIMAVLIFVFSAENGEVSGERSDGVIDIIAKIFIPDYDEMSTLEKMEITRKMGYHVRKCMHVAEYTLLTALVALFVWGFTYKMQFTLPIPICFSFMFAMCDELILQRSTQGRSGQFVDVLIDFIGMVIGTFAVFLIMTLIKRRREEKLNENN